MAKNISVELGEHFEKFIQESLKGGRFKDAGEVIRAALRLLEEEEKKIYFLRNAVKEGIASGIVEDFDPEKHLRELKNSKNE